MHRHRRGGLTASAGLAAVGVVVAASCAAPGAYAAAARASQAAVTYNGLNYNGGAVQHNPKVFLIFWGPDWTSNSTDEADENALITTFKDLAGTSYNNILTQYYDGSGHVSNDTELAGVWNDPSVPGTTGLPDPSDPTDVHGVGMFNIAQEAYFSLTQLPPACLSGSGCSNWNDGYSKWGNDIQIMVIPQQGTNYNSSSVDGLSSSDLCGNHDNTNTTVAYAVTDHFAFSVVKYGSDNSCADGSRVSLTYTAVHEYAESVTDPQPVASPGWYTGSPVNGELADKCEPSGTGLGQLAGNEVPELWDNTTGGCAIALGRDSYDLGCGRSPLYILSPSFYNVWDASGLGCPAGNAYADSGGSAQSFTNGHIYDDGASPPDIQAIAGPADTDYQSLGGPTSALGFPDGEKTVPGSSGDEYLFDGTSCHSGSFQGVGSVIYVSPAGHAAQMQGCIYRTYLGKYGGPTGNLGYPTSNEVPMATGRVNYMQGTTCGSSSGSALYWDGTVNAVYGCIFQKYKSVGEANSGLGFPVGDEYAYNSGRRQDFQFGYIIYTSATGAVVTYTSNCVSYPAYTTGPGSCGGGFATNNQPWFSGGGTGLLSKEIWTYANGGTVDSTATWTWYLPTGRAWELEVYIPDNHSDATHVHYAIGGSSPGSGYVDQENYTNQWAVAGYGCATPGTGQLTLTVDDGGGDSYPLEVGADAARVQTSSYACPS